MSWNHAFLGNPLGGGPYGENRPYGSNPTWSPPPTMNVIDRHGGFTIESKPPLGEKRWGEREVSHGRLRVGDSLWRPGSVLRGSTVGRLVAYGPSFYQTDDNAILAVYRVAGYGYPVLVWFNARGERIA